MNTENGLDRFRCDIQMDVKVDASLVFACHTMAGTVKTSPGSADAFNAIKHLYIDKSLLMDLNNSGRKFEEIVDYLDRPG